MFDLITTAAPGITSVDDIEEVARANQALREAIEKQDQLKEEETNLWRLVAGKVVDASPDDIIEADDRLAGSRGADQGRYLPERIQADRAAAKARKHYEEVRSVAKEQVTEHGVTLLRPLIQKLDEAVAEAIAVAEEIQETILRLGQAGAEPFDNPCPMLLPNGHIAWQLRLAKQKVGLDT